jgi:hypothetical protein
MTTPLMSLQKSICMAPSCNYPSKTTSDPIDYWRWPFWLTPLGASLIWRLLVRVQVYLVSPSGGGLRQSWLVSMPDVDLAKLSGSIPGRWLIMFSFSRWRQDNKLPDTDHYAVGADIHFFCRSEISVMSSYVISGTATRK